MLNTGRQRPLCCPFPMTRRQPGLKEQNAVPKPCWRLLSIWSCLTSKPEPRCTGPGYAPCRRSSVLTNRRLWWRRIICNGYKDEYFIRHALHGRRLGKKVVLVVEKMGEIHKIIEMATAMEVEPLIGMRIRLNAKASGNWGASGGSSAKFGLTTAEIIEAVNLLRESGFESSFKLLHFHIGSQIPDIRDVNRAVREGARYYAKLYQYGCQVEYLDVGGGLGVDYDGSATVFSSSINYSLQEYANDIVASVVDVCDEEKVPHPNIISESGRALVAHHSMIVVDALGSIEKLGAVPPKIGKDSHKLGHRMQDIEKRLSRDTLTECYHDLVSIRERAQSMFLARPLRSGKQGGGGNAVLEDSRRHCQTV